MEGLIIVLFEVIAGPIMALVSAIAGLFGVLLSTIISLLTDFLVRPALKACLRKKNPVETSSRSGSKKILIDAPSPTFASASEKIGPSGLSVSRSGIRWWRWLSIITASGAACVLAAMLVINQWFISDIVRMLLRKQQERTGISVVANSISGNLFSGYFQARGLRILTDETSANQIDIDVQSVSIEIDVWRVLATPLVIHGMTIEGMSGRYVRGIGEKTYSTQQDANATVPDEIERKELTELTHQKVKSGRAFSISDFNLTNLDVIYGDARRPHSSPLPVAVNYMKVQSLRSEWAIFDVLFRSNTKGAIVHQPFSISTSGDALGRDTQWHVDGLPVEVLADHIGGPFALLTAGTADVHVVDHWRRVQDRLVLVMDWSVIFHPKS
jgi:hypothetical protein